MIQRPCESINVQRCWALNFAVACLYFNHGNCKHYSGYMWLCYTTPPELQTMEIGLRGSAHGSAQFLPVAKLLPTSTTHRLI